MIGIEPPTCLCGSPMVLRQTLKFRYGNGEPRRFWGCSCWPACDGVIGAHPDGTPVGTVADDATKAERRATHALFDQLWDRRLNVGAPLRRVEAYGLLAWLMRLDEDQAHIGMFDADRCRALRWRLRGLYPELVASPR